MVVEKKQIQSKPVYGGELRRGKSFQPVLIFLTLCDGFAVVSADSAKSGPGAGDSLLFRVGKSVMKCQGTAGNLLFKYCCCEFFEAGIFRKNVYEKQRKYETYDWKSHQNDPGEQGGFGNINSGFGTVWHNVPSRAGGFLLYY